MIFDQSKNRFDRSKMLQLIHHQSSTDRNKQRLTNIFNCNFDWSESNFNWSRFWKNQFFFKKKKSKIMQKLLKALKFMNHMHEYEMKYFSKTHVLNPVFPKLKFSIHYLKISNIKYVLHKTQGIFKLGWSNQKHTQQHVQSLAKSNLCNVCNQ